MQASSRNGIGTQLLFHRPAGPGLFEAAIWATFIYIPLFPMSTWLVRPQGISSGKTSSGGDSTTHMVEFLERRKMSLLGILRMYLGVAIALFIFLAPLVVFFPIMSHFRGWNKTWAGALLYLLPILWAAGVLFILSQRRDKLYESAVRQQSAGAAT